VKVIAVVGSASGSGKTTVACAILRAVPGLAAVKVSPRDEEPRVEWGPGQPGKDTARFAASGASPVARIVAPRDRVRGVWEGVRERFAGAPAVLVEGAGALALVEERFTVVVADAGTIGERPERDARLAALADYIVAVGPDGAAAAEALANADRRAVPVVPVSEDTTDWDLRHLVEAARSFLGRTR
jgi:hypothetical protein